MLETLAISTDSVHVDLAFRQDTAYFRGLYYVNKAGFHKVYQWPTPGYVKHAADGAVLPVSVPVYLTTTHSEVGHCLVSISYNQSVSISYLHSRIQT